MNNRIIAALVAMAPLVSLADEPKVYLPQFAQHTSICGDGSVLTYTLQCDPGSRPPIERIWSPTGAGLELCRVSETRCEPVKGLSPAARPGFEVLDSWFGQLVVVGFGLDRLLGVAP